MRVTRVAVNGLFGTFDHNVALRLDEHITIVHGPNGFGKTVLLRMLAGLLSGSHDVFRTTPFDMFQVWFDTGASIRVLKPPPTKDSNPRRRKHFVHSEKPVVCQVTIGGISTEFQLGQVLPRPVPPELLRLIDAQIPVPLTLHSDGWYDTQQGTSYTADEIADTYWTRLKSQLGDAFVTVDDALRQIRGEINVRLVRTQRLESPQAPAASPRNAAWYAPYGQSQPQSQPTALTVETYSEELAGQMRATLGQYAARAQELDRTFPERLLKQQTERQQTLSKAELRSRFQDIESRRSQLVRLGFIDEQGFSLVPEELLTTQPAVLSIYVDDVEKKLGVFDDMVARIGLFVRVLNDRFTYKALSVHRSNGFVFRVKRSDERLSPSALSSGEQHELVLLFELIFKVNRTWLVLIDEPEISLHASWQERFLDDLKEVVHLSNVDVVLATHSPVLIGDNWNLTATLEGPAEK